MSSGLTLRGISKNYGNVRAVSGLDLEIASGELITLLGPSGCGKTTILRLIAGFEKPDGGTISLGGREVAGGGHWVPPENRGIGMVFQDYALFPHLTVRENVGFGLMRTKPSEREARIGRMLSLVGLEGMGDRYPYQLSGGQQQRVAMARAMAPAPLALLLDEPFSNLDAGLRVQMRRELRQILKEAGMTAVMVTHDQKDALAISDRVAVINEGRLEQIGEPREIYQFPANRFVARFVGQTNLLEGVLIGNQVRTPFGPVPCSHTHGLPDKSEVLVSVRPDSFEVDAQGPFDGRVSSVVYGGNSVEMEIVVHHDGCEARLWIHSHPEIPVSEGDRIRFRATPYFVAVLDREPA